MPIIALMLSMILGESRQRCARRADGAHDSGRANDDEEADSTRCTCVKAQRFATWNAECQNKSGDLGGSHDEGDDKGKALIHHCVPFVWCRNGRRQAHSERSSIWFLPSSGIRWRTCPLTVPMTPPM